MGIGLDIRARHQARVLGRGNDGNGLGRSMPFEVVSKVVVVLVNGLTYERR